MIPYKQHTVRMMHTRKSLTAFAFAVGREMRELRVHYLATAELAGRLDYRMRELEHEAKRARR
jgi:hypothetical protein